MFKAVFLIALAFGVASAQRWPMITVNAAGEIVLQSLTRAQSFQITPASATTAPTSSGTASLSTASPLSAGVSAYIITTASSPAAGHGVTLPAPTTGAQVTLFQSQTTFASYTIWSSAASVFINNDATSNSITVLARRVVCQAVSTTRWNCIQDTVDTAVPTSIFNVLAYTATASVTLTTPQSGAFISIQPAAAATLTATLPSCVAANVGVNYRFTMINSAAVVGTLTLTPQTSDKVYVTVTGRTTTVSAILTTTTANIGTVTGSVGAAGTAATIATTAVIGEGFDVTLTCVAANQWFGLGVAIKA